MTELYPTIKEWSSTENLQGKDVPGIGFRRLAARTLDGGSGIVNEASWQVLGRTAMGYEFEHFYIGAMGSIILRSFEYKGYQVDLGTEQFRITVGKRFDVSRNK